eukprot:1178166-Prorocentrum_minimum.AAC.1
MLPEVSSVGYHNTTGLLIDMHLHHPLRETSASRVAERGGIEIVDCSHGSELIRILAVGHVVQEVEPALRVLAHGMREGHATPRVHPKYVVPLVASLLFLHDRSQVLRRPAVPCRIWGLRPRSRVLLEYHLLGGEEGHEVPPDRPHHLSRDGAHTVTVCDFAVVASGAADLLRTIILRICVLKLVVPVWPIERSDLLPPYELHAFAQGHVWVKVTRGPCCRAFEVVLVAEREKVDLRAFAPRGLHLPVHVAVFEGHQEFSTHQLVQVGHYEHILIADVPRPLFEIVAGVPLLLPFALFERRLGNTTCSLRSALADGVEVILLVPDLRQVLGEVRASELLEIQRLFLGEPLAPCVPSLLQNDVVHRRIDFLQDNGQQVHLVGDVRAIEDLASAGSPLSAQAPATAGLRAPGVLFDDPTFNDLGVRAHLGVPH